MLDLETGEAVLYARLAPAKFKSTLANFTNRLKLPTPVAFIVQQNRLSQQETGDTEHLEFAEKYPTIISFWEWENRYIVGFPDGLTDEFVYEFRSVNSYYLLQHLKPVALAPAGLYAYFLDRPKIGYRSESNRPTRLRLSNKSSPDSAAALLKTMLALLDGSTRPIPGDGLEMQGLQLQDTVSPFKPCLGV